MVPVSRRMAPAELAPKGAAPKPWTAKPFTRAAASHRQRAFQDESGRTGRGQGQERQREGQEREDRVDKGIDKAEDEATRSAIHRSSAWTSGTPRSR